MKSLEERASATDDRVARIRALIDNELAARALDAVLAGLTRPEPEVVLGALVTAIALFASADGRTDAEAEEFMIDAAGALLVAATPVTVAVAIPGDE